MLKGLIYILISIMFVSSIPNSGCHSVEEKGKEGWGYDTIQIDNSCAMYIEYAAGKYLLNISTIDSCNNLSNSKYLDVYKILLNKFSHKLLSNKGIVTFHTPFPLLNDTAFTNSLIDITNKKFDSYHSMIKKDSFMLRIYIEPKRKKGF